MWPPFAMFGFLVLVLQTRLLAQDLINMETLPFHNHVEFEDNDEDKCGKPKNSKEIKEEICDYSPIKIDCLVSILRIQYVCLLN